MVWCWINACPRARARTSHPCVRECFRLSYNPPSHAPVKDLGSRITLHLPLFHPLSDVCVMFGASISETWFFPTPSLVTSLPFQPTSPYTAATALRKVGPLVWPVWGCPAKCIMYTYYAAFNWDTLVSFHALYSERRDFCSGLRFGN